MSSNKMLKGGLEDEKILNRIGKLHTRDDEGRIKKRLAAIERVVLDEDAANRNL
jgi:hypothetical protein